MPFNSPLVIHAIIGGLIAFLGTTSCLPWLIRNSRRLGVMDFPNGRKVHRESIPRVGGISMLISFVPAFFWYVFWAGFRPEWSMQFACVLMGTAMILLIGVMDDTKGLAVKHKFLGQFVSAAVVVFGGITFSAIDLGWLGKYSFRSLETFITVLYIVGITNAINLIDGLDGLAGGVALIITSAFLGLSLLSNDGVGLILVLCTLIGGLSGFLIYNRWPAKVFLGDTGSLFLGWSFAILSISYAQKSSVTLSIAIPIMVLGLPAFDVIFVMVKRVMSNHQQGMVAGWLSMFKPDKNHLHHLILSCGVSRKHAVWILYGVTVLTSVVAFSSWVMKSNGMLIYNVSAVFLFILVVRLTFEIRLYRRSKTKQVKVVETQTTPVKIVQFHKGRLETRVES